MEQVLNYVNGEFVETQSKKTISHLQPTTGEPDLLIPDSDLLDLVRAIQASNKAVANWQKVETEARAEVLMKLAQRIETHTDQFARAQSLDDGTPIRLARTVLIPKAVAVLRAQAQWLLSEKSEALVGQKSIWIKNRLPVGVVAILTPWADATFALSSRVGAALAAGNVVIAKPSEYAPRVASEFAKAIHDAGIGPGIVNLVHGRGDQLGQAIIDHPGLSMISFMGQTETGRLIQRGAAENLKRVHLSLGARNPVLVFAETDLEKTVTMVAKSVLGFHGPTCLRGSRIFVQDPIYKEFLERFKNEVAKWKVGDPLSEETDLGPLPNASYFEKYKNACHQAESERGKSLFSEIDFGVSQQRGYFVNPVAYYDLTLCSTLQQEELVGPYATIASFKYQHDAIKHANNSPFGQAAYLYLGQASKAARVALKIEAGRVFVNSAGPLFEAKVGYSGLKNSGFGRDGFAGLVSFFSRETAIGQDIG